MNAVNSVVRSDEVVASAGTSREEAGLASKALSYFKGALIVSAVIYVTISWALESVARFN